MTKNFFRRKPRLILALILIAAGLAMSLFTASALSPATQAETQTNAFKLPSSPAKAHSEPIVFSEPIDGESNVIAPLEAGLDMAQYVSVQGAEGVPQEVVWSVIGSESPRTVINADGWLYVSIDEPADVITVRATLVFDPTKYAEATVNVVGDCLYLTDLPTQLSPKNLLVIVMNYNNGYYDAPDAEVEEYWSDLIFGTGVYEDGDASINDFFREMSGGKFWWNPVLLGDSATGVYSYHLNKDYSDMQGLHPEWPYFEYEYDMMYILNELAGEGLDINEFTAEGITNQNYRMILPALFTAPQSSRNPQWYATSNILLIRPPYNFDKTDFAPLSPVADAFVLAARVGMDSEFGTVAHELCHTLGAVDVYRWCSCSSDLMSDGWVNWMPAPYYAAHVDPFYKVVWGWARPRVIAEPGEYTLWPATSGKYNPVIVKTDSPNQYFIIENRQSEKFDTGLRGARSYGHMGGVLTSSDGINIWRIDRLGCEAIYNASRKGISLEAILRTSGSRTYLNPYRNSENITDTGLETLTVEISHPVWNADGSITVSIDF